MEKVLDAAQTTSDVWISSGRNGIIILTGHAGGTWTLQIQAPDGTWVDTDVTFTANGVQTNFYTVPGFSYRLTGGSAGASAWAHVLPGA